MPSFLGEILHKCQTGQITEDEFMAKLKQRAVKDAQSLREFQKPEVKDRLVNLCLEAGNDWYLSQALAGFTVEITQQNIKGELNECTDRLLFEKAMFLAGQGRRGQEQAGRLMRLVKKRRAGEKEAV